MAAERRELRVASCDGKYGSVLLPIHVGVPVRSQEREIHLSVEPAAPEGVGD